MPAQGDLDTARRHGLQALHYMGAPLPSEEPSRGPVFARLLYLVSPLACLMPQQLPKYKWSARTFTKRTLTFS